MRIKVLNSILAAALMLFSVSAFSDFDVRLQGGTISAFPQTGERFSVVMVDKASGERMLKIFTYRMEYKTHGQVVEYSHYVLESVTITDIDNPDVYPEKRKLIPNPNPN